jgi:two-component system, NarL family, response regulator NreC
MAPRKATRIITLVLADDHLIFRDGLRALLVQEPDLQVVGETGNGLEAIKLVEQLKPDVLVLDLMMPGVNGDQAARQVRRRVPSTRIVVLSMHTNEAYVLRALKCGADGYVCKDSGITELVQAIHQVTQGHRYLGSPLSERAIELYVQKAKEAPLDPYETLTLRERQVLQLAAQSYSNAEIGERLLLSARTIETHRTKMMRKLGLRNQTDLVRYALRNGILPMDD